MGQMREGREEGEEGGEGEEVDSTTKSEEKHRDWPWEGTIGKAINLVGVVHLRGGRSENEEGYFGGVYSTIGGGTGRQKKKLFLFTYLFERRGAYLREGGYSSTYCMYILKYVYYSLLKYYLNS